MSNNNHLAPAGSEISSETMAGSATYYVAAYCGATESITLDLEAGSFTTFASAQTASHTARLGGLVGTIVVEHRELWRYGKRFGVRCVALSVLDGAALPIRA